MTTNIGNTGEQIFYHRARRFHKVEWVADDKNYWGKDIDFIVTNPRTGETRTIEVKTDTRLYETGNLYIELKNVHSKGGKGWYYFSEADIIAYCDYSAPDREIYLFSFEDLRATVHKREYATAKCGTDSKGILVPLRELKEVPSFRVLRK